MKNIVITGATSGIGLALTKNLAAKDYKIIMACRDINKANKIREEISRTTNNENILVTYLDLEKKESIKELVNFIVKNNMSLDILVNNAGGFNEAHEEIYGIEKTMYVNFFATKELTERLLPLIKSNGKIINIASKAGLYGDISQEVINDKKFCNFKSYSASKLALILYTEDLARRLLKTTDINVYSVHPGAVATNIWNGKSILMKLMAPIMKLTSKKPEKAIDTIVYIIENNILPGFYGDRKLIELKGKSFSKETYNNYNELIKEKQV